MVVGTDTKDNLKIRSVLCPGCHRLVTRHKGSNEYEQVNIVSKSSPFFTSYNTGRRRASNRPHIKIRQAPGKDLRSNIKGPCLESWLNSLWSVLATEVI